MTKKIPNAAKQHIFFTETTSWIADITEMMKARKQDNGIFKVLYKKRSANLVQRKHPMKIKVCKGIFEQKLRELIAKV